MTTGAYLQVYEAETYHADVHIFGNRQALEQLRSQIDHVLRGQDSDPRGWESYFQSDGEGYRVEVRLASDYWMNKLPTAYKNDMLLVQSEWTEAESKAWAVVADGSGV